MKRLSILVISRTKPDSTGLLPDPAALSDADIYAAMQAISGYLDITTNDLKEVYLLAFEHAQQRLFSVPVERFMSTRFFSVIRSF